MRKLRSKLLRKYLVAETPDYTASEWRLWKRIYKQRGWRTFSPVQVYASRSKQRSRIIDRILDAVHKGRLR